METWAFEAIGTRWQIDTRQPLNQDVRTEILQRIDAFDRTWSRFRSDSLVNQMTHAAGTWTLDQADVLLGFYDELHEATGGAVNPLVGAALADLGYDAGYSLRPAEHIAPVPAWPSIQRSGCTVTTAEPVLLDVGAAGKGLAVDLVAGILWATGLHEATVDAGGDLYHCGTRPIRVALEHPADPSRAIGVVELEPEDALCGSATNRRAWGDGLHHVLDARTGRPTETVVAAWVLVAGSCMHADGLATAHFFADPEALAEVYPHRFVRVHADGRVLASSDLPGEVFA